MLAETWIETGVERVGGSGTDDPERPGRGVTLDNDQRTSRYGLAFADRRVRLVAMVWLPDERSAPGAVRRRSRADVWRLVQASAAHRQGKARRSGDALRHD